MAIHSNGTTPSGATPIVESRNWTFSTTGVSRVTEVWQVNTDYVAQAAPAWQTPHATISGLYVSQPVEAAESDCNITLMTVIYEGYTGGISGVDISTVAPVYTWNGTLESRQIQLHPRFNAAIAYVKSLGKEPEDELGRFVGFPVGTTSADGKQLAGITSYVNASGTWSKSWIQSSRPVAMAGVGYVGTPPGTPPTFTDGREWLVGPMTYREAGGVFECNQIWLLSEPGGFSAFYTPPA
jgi:hypothetical protein